MLDWMTKLFKSDRVNQLLIEAFLKRGFKFLNESTELLDLQFYYSHEPALVGYKNGQPYIEIKLHLYSANNESFINYKYYASIHDSFSGFTAKNSFDDRYCYISMVIARIFNENDLLSVIEDELMEVN